LKILPYEYVIICRNKYEGLQTRAAVKTVAAKKLLLADGKKMAYKLIDKWAKGK
jgi:hypothetical protein